MVDEAPKTGIRRIAAAVDCIARNVATDWKSSVFIEYPALLKMIESADPPEHSVATVGKCVGEGGGMHSGSCIGQRLAYVNEPDIHQESASAQAASETARCRK